MENLIQKIQHIAPLDIINHELDRNRSKVVHFVDEDSLDSMHHAIISNYAEIVRLLFLKGLFLEPHQPNIPYLHLACYFGRAAIISIILDERPGDLKECIFRYPITNKFQEFHDAKSIDSQKSEMVIFETSPVEIAAKHQHLKCVEILLGRWQMKYPKFNLYECAVEINSPKALNLLLENGKTIQGEVDKALREAVRRKRAECIDQLLQHGANPSASFNKLNAFHIMYMYSSAFQQVGERNKGLSDSTAVLIKNGVDINSNNPPGSFPLYSLITSLIKELEYSDTDLPEEHFQSLVMLLDVKANPNFNEHLVEAGDNGESGVFGREKAPSALHALFLAAVQMERRNMKIHQKDEDYIYKTCELLIKYGADLKVMHNIYETPLHLVMACLAVEHGTGALRWDLGPTIKLLLLSGADPNGSPWHPVNVYFDALWECENLQVTSENLQQALSLLYFMDSESVQESISLLNTVMETRPPIEKTKQKIKIELDNILLGVRPLLLSCQLAIWKFVNRKKENVLDLPLPSEIKGNIFSSFDMVL